MIALKSDIIPHNNVEQAISHAAITKSLQTFLDRNALQDSGVALSLPSQKVLSRFFGLPLRDKKKLDDVMNWEVKQQIPLPLETIAWDYQIFKSENESPPEYVVPDVRIALFAIKCDEVEAQMKLLVDRKIKVDVVQSDAAALLNFLLHEHSEIDRQRTEHSGERGLLGMLDIGTDSSNLIITDRNSLMLRSIPLGGDNFTRALARHYHLDWQQAEKLKRKPTQAPLLHQLYGALQPAFQSLYDEVHRSIDQFKASNRDLVFDKLLVRGGGLKLHGLLKFLWFEQ